VAFLLLGKGLQEAGTAKKDQKYFAQAITAAVGSTDKPKYGVSELQAEIKFCVPKKASKRKVVSPPETRSSSNSALPVTLVRPFSVKSDERIIKNHKMTLF
jgi:hypothetical protein